jgi:hypothetical protein
MKYRIGTLDVRTVPPGMPTAEAYLKTSDRLGKAARSHALRVDTSQSLCWQPGSLFNDPSWPPFDDVPEHFRCPYCAMIAFKGRDDPLPVGTGSAPAARARDGYRTIHHALVIDSAAERPTRALCTGISVQPIAGPFLDSDRQRQCRDCLNALGAMSTAG